VTDPKTCIWDDHTSITAQTVFLEAFDQASLDVGLIEPAHGTGAKPNLLRHQSSGATLRLKNPVRTKLELHRHDVQVKALMRSTLWPLGTVQALDALVANALCVPGKHSGVDHVDGPRAKRDLAPIDPTRISAVPTSLLPEHGLDSGAVPALEAVGSIKAVELLGHGLGIVVDGVLFVALEPQLRGPMETSLDMIPCGAHSSPVRAIVGAFVDPQINVGG
jgi:hypothetical protein